MVLNSATDDPPYSRLFVVYNKNDALNEDELQNDFGQFGEVHDIFIVKDRTNGEPKGVAYIKFSKMSEAATALENLNNTPIKNHSGTYKVYIAKNRNESRNVEDDPDRYLRLFIIVPKTAEESDIKEHFSKFGNIQTVKLLRYKETKESKGIGYVTYTKISEAAKAVEAGENELGFKAVIARPKEKSYPPTYENTNYSSHGKRSSSFNSSEMHSVDDCFRASVSSKLTEDQIFRLFDIAPGLRDVKLTSHNMYRSEVIATYNSSLAAEYALNKLHGIEYPVGEFISIESKTLKKPVQDATMSIQSFSHKRDSQGKSVIGDSSTSFNNGPASRDVNEKLNALTSALLDATALLKSAGLSTESQVIEDDDDNKWSQSSYCNFPLPHKQPILPKSSFHEDSGMRLFFVGHPSAPSSDALNDVYCRFGNFSGVSIGPRKNYGYLYFTSPESALKAIELTDEKIISGMSMKVLRADPRTESGSKRRKPNH